MDGLAFITTVILSAWVTQGALSLVNVLHFRRQVAEHLRRFAVHAGALPPAAVIVPVKGASAGLAETVRAMLDQDYPRLRFAFAVESVDDPAHAALCDVLAAHGDRAEIVVAGLAAEGSQKVHNLIAALRRLRADDQVIIVADADMMPPRDWFARLVAPLITGDWWASSAYRWLIPADRALPSMITAAADHSRATISRRRSWNMTWGGSTALRRSAVDRLALADALRGSFNDDVVIANLIRSAGGSVCWHAGLLVPTPVAFTWRSMAVFIRRQHVHLRLYRPGVWLAFAGATTLPAVGWIVAVAASVAGSTPALLALLAMTVGDVVRAVVREDAARCAVGDAVERMAGTFWLDALARPLVMGVNAAGVWSASFVRRVTWAGITYEIGGRYRVRILSR